MSHLYKLPKEMLIKLITTIQENGVEYLTDDQLEKRRVDIINEQYKRNVENSTEDFLKWMTEHDYSQFTHLVQNVYIDKRLFAISVKTEYFTIKYYFLNDLWDDDTGMYPVSPVNYSLFKTLIESFMKNCFSYITINN